MRPVQFSYGAMLERAYVSVQIISGSVEKETYHAFWRHNIEDVSETDCRASHLAIERLGFEVNALGA